MILADAYGYTVTLPSTLNTAHATLDEIGGTLLVQGSPRDNAGAGANDTINVTLVGGDVQVQVNTPTLNTTEVFSLADVSRIVIAGHGGADNITVDAALGEIAEFVDYVVSSNQDAIEDANSAAGGTLGDDIVDLNLVIPGSQTTLRAAVRDANNAGAARGIYLPPNPGNYHLTLTGGGTDTDAINDLDITGDVTIVGAGAGLSVIEAGFAVTPNNNTRVFEISGANRSLALSGLTVAGGDTASAGGAAFVTNGGSLTAQQVAFVDNHAAQRGGAVRNMGGTIDITDSVFTGNTSDFWGGAISSAEANGTVNLGRNVFAENNALQFANTELSNGTFTSEGLNLIDDVDGANGFFSPENGDRIEVTAGDIDVVTSVADTFDHNDDATARSLREAVDDANADDGTVWAPAWRIGLDRNGAESIANNDLDIMGDITLLGVGAGLTVIDLSGLDDPTTDTQNRAFHILPGLSLDLSSVTVANGVTTMSAAGSLALVSTGGVLNVTESAVVNHMAMMAHGVAIRSVGGDVNIRRSVFTNNTSDTTFTTGAVYGSGGGSITVGESVFALNNNFGTGSPNIAFDGTVATTSLGNNLFDDDGVGASQFFTDVSDRTGTPDLVVTNVADEVKRTDDAYALTLREAVQTANVTAGDTEVWAPGWHFRLTRNGSETNDAAFNDLDITGVVSVVGVGPGLTVIDAGGLDDDAFDGSNHTFEVRPSVSASLDVSRVTLMGGRTVGAVAGHGAFVWNGGTLNVSDSAIVNQTGMANGVAIRSIGGDVTVLRSVITNNTSTGNSSGIYATGGGSLTIGESIFALNSGVTHDNVFADGTVTSTSQGYNLYDTHNAAGNSFSFNGTGDHQGTPTRVVTSVADTFEHDGNAFALSLREAIDLANGSSGEELWLPAWDFVLTRDRGVNSTDTEVGYGDLDIKSSLTIRGISGSTAQTNVSWRAGIVDAVFDLLGDYNGDGISNGTDDGSVDAADYSVWRNTLGSTTDLRADGDDDGVVDQDDYDIWRDHYGSSLSLINV